MISSIHPPLLTTCLGPFSTIPVGGLFLVIYLVRLLGFTYFAHVHYLLTINLPWNGYAFSCVSVISHSVPAHALPVDEV